MSDVKDMQKRIVEFRDARDWKQFHNPKDLALSLVLEATEVLEHFQWKSPEEIKNLYESFYNNGNPINNYSWFDFHAKY